MMTSSPLPRPDNMADISRADEQLFRQTESLDPINVVNSFSKASPWGPAARVSASLRT